MITGRQTSVHTPVYGRQKEALDSRHSSNRPTDMLSGKATSPGNQLHRPVKNWTTNGEWMFYFQRPMSAVLMWEAGANSRPKPLNPNPPDEPHALVRTHTNVKPSSSASPSPELNPERPSPATRTLHSELFISDRITSLQKQKLVSWL